MILRLNSSPQSLSLANLEVPREELELAFAPPAVSWPRFILEARLESGECFLPKLPVGAVHCPQGCIAAAPMGPGPWCTTCEFAALQLSPRGSSSCFLGSFSLFSSSKHLQAQVLFLLAFFPPSPQLTSIHPLEMLCHLDIFKPLPCLWF